MSLSLERYIAHQLSKNSNRKISGAGRIHLADYLKRALNEVIKHKEKSKHRVKRESGRFPSLLHFAAARGLLQRISVVQYNKINTRNEGDERA